MAVLGLADNEAAQEWLAQLTQHQPTESPTQVDVLPENHQAVSVFVALQTQWNLLVGMCGCAHQGLNYGALHTVLQLMCIPKREWKPLFDDIRLMEMAALRLLNQTAPD